MNHRSPRDHKVETLDKLLEQATLKGFNEKELHLLEVSYGISLNEYMDRYPYSGELLTHERREDYDSAMRMYAASKSRLFIAKVVDDWHRTKPGHKQETE